MSAKKKKITRGPRKTLQNDPGKSNPPAAARMRRAGLGRGLGALISANAAVPQPAPPAPPRQHPDPDTSAAQAATNAVISVPPVEIQRSPWQPRQAFDAEPLRELADSIRANGVIQPLVCRKNKDGKYELIAGERRLRAAHLAGLTLVPVILVDAGDRRAAELAIIENIQRQDLNVIEEAEGYQTLTETFHLTQQEVADRVGKARATVANALRLLDLPDEAKQLLGDGLLTTGHAKVLLGLDDPMEQTLLARKCVTEDLTVRALERAIRRRKASSSTDSSTTSSKPDLPENYVRDLCERLHSHFNTAVRLSPSATHANGRHTKGILEIDFYDNNDLDRILELLGIILD